MCYKNRIFFLDFVQIRSKERKLKIYNICSGENYKRQQITEKIGDFWTMYWGL